MPLILDQLGFPVSSDYFDEPVVRISFLSRRLFPCFNSDSQEPEFNEDRVVVRDGDDTQKKRWFSRKKKPSPSPTVVSRPPSMSFGSSTRKSSSLKKSLDDGDLPARESTGTPPLPVTNPASLQVADGQSRSSAADVPVHAGFDLKAIKEMIEESGENPEELQVPPSSRIHSPPVVSRSDSASPDSVNRIVSARIPTASPVAPHADLSATFATSLSLHSGSDVDDDSQGMPPVATDIGSKEDLAYTSSATAHTSTIPQTFFSGNEGLIWSPPPLEKRSPAFVDPFATNSVLLDNPNGSIRDSSFSHVPYSPEMNSSALLSFGGVDGTITSQDLGQDPWNIPAGGAKKTKTPNYLSNPWST